MSDLPREKLIKLGVKNLEDYELIAILLRTGSKDEDVLALSKRIVNLYPHRNYMKQTRLEDLVSVKGISLSKGATILAAIELGRRIHEIKFEKNKTISNTLDLYHLLKNGMEYLEQEHLIVVTLDIKGNILKQETIYIGTTTQITVSVKDLFKTAIKFGAYGIVMAHNHPTGDAKPSMQDDILTEKVKKASTILGIDFVDHIIIGKNEYYSYKEQYLFKV